MGKSHEHLVFWLITCLAFITRFWKLHEPPVVIFDEVHFGKFAAYYIRQTFYFDVHPPLGKLLLALVGWCIGFDGGFLFKDIGISYTENNVPYVMLRAWTALCGAVIVPFVYLTLREMGLSLWACSLTALLLIFENSQVLQSRLILLDSMLMVFMCGALYAYVRFYKLRYQPYSLGWWVWLHATGLFLALTTSIKYVGVFTVALVGISVIQDLWRKLDVAQGLSLSEWGWHFAARAWALILFPFIVYLSIFWVHFAVLYKSGPGDAFMSQHFQSTLEGNAVMVNTQDVFVYDNVTFFHPETKTYLHSHPERYPLRYDDGRVSSQGQQVTAYPHRDVNNWWRIKPAYPTPFDLKSMQEINHRASLTTCPVKWKIEYPVSVRIEISRRPLRDGELVHVEHIATGTHLLTHDVASPLTKTNTEYTTIDPTNKERFNETVFRIEFDDKNAQEDKEYCRSYRTVFRIVHVGLDVSLSTRESAILPEWGFGQLEVNGNKKKKDPEANLWYVKHIQGRHVTKSEVEGRELATMPFLSKYAHLQRLMVEHNSRLTSSHPFQSNPISWPFLLRGISYWQYKPACRHIYLMGNVVGWWLGGLAVIAYFAIMAADALCRQRGFHPIDEHVRTRLIHAGGFLVLGYFLHYIPFFLMGRQLFLHHYLPASIFAYMMVGVLFEFCVMESVQWPTSPGITLNKDQAQHTTRQAGWWSWLVWLVVLVCQVLVFLWLSEMTFGDGTLTPEEWKQRKLLSSWDLMD